MERITSKKSTIGLLFAIMGFSIIFSTGVFAADVQVGDDTTIGNIVETDAATATPTTTAVVGVEYRGHVQDYGDYPTNGTWIQGDNILGTTGESRRIEGFKIELTGGTAIPTGAGIRYNVHSQNEGWQNDPANLTDTSKWKANGAFAGSTGLGQRVEAIEMVLVGADGKTLPGYSVQYQVHGENYGWTQGWKADGAIAGTSGKSLRIEAIQIKIVKNAAAAYNTAGTYGPKTGTEVVNSDVTVGADGVTLQNLHIKGDLIIAKEVGSGTVNLNNVTVDGNTYVRGGGENSIHINGGSYNNIIVEKTASGNVRIVATDATGLAVVISEDAKGQDIILEGAFDTVKIQAPDVKVSTRGNTTIKELNVAAGAKGAEITLDSKTTVQKAVLDAAVDMKGTGTINQANVNANNVTFEQKPVKLTVAPDVTVPPVVTPGGGGSPSVAVSAITVTGNGDATTITTDNGTLQMLAAVEPAGATNKTVTWSVTNGTGTAVIDASTGLLRAVTNGTVTVKATSVSMGTVYGEKVITIAIAAPTVTLGAAKATGNFGNEANINEMMTALFTAGDKTVQGIAIKSVFSVNDGVLTINGDNVSEGLLQWIKTQWGGSSVPVAISFSNGTPKDMTTDANWDNDYTEWVDLGALVAGEETVEVAMTNGTIASYDVTTTTTPVAPTGVTGVAATIIVEESTVKLGASYGKITGVDASMEYKLKSSGTWIAIPEGTTEITGLVVGTYNVRYAAKQGSQAGDIIDVVVKANIEYSISGGVAAESILVVGIDLEITRQDGGDAESYSQGDVFDNSGSGSELAVKKTYYFYDIVSENPEDTATINFACSYKE